MAPVALSSHGVPDFAFFRHGTADARLTLEDLPLDFLNSTRACGSIRTAKFWLRSGITRHGLSRYEFGRSDSQPCSSFRRRGQNPPHQDVSPLKRTPEVSHALLYRRVERSWAVCAFM
ncbi:hypothetical protein CEB3_c39080 [Peptococcaceae bacterium CEB3]|nr:hypothetical protein CEB3_c39080 [Peptococcaceae bacterium CEB3]